MEAIPDLATLSKLADTCGQVHGLRPASRRRGPEPGHHPPPDLPGVGGMVTKQTKGRNVSHVPILAPLLPILPILERLTAGTQPEDPPTSLGLGTE